MYASIQVFEDDGKPLMHFPYIIPPTDIRSHPDVEIGKDKISVHYEFKFVMSRIELPLESRKTCAFIKED